MGIACPVINTEVLKQFGVVANGEMQTVMGVTVFPKEYFSPKDSQTYITKITENTYSIHHYDATWKNKNAKLKQKIIIAVVKIIGKKNFMKIKAMLKK